MKNIYRVERIHDYILECTMCHFYYVEQHMSLKDVSRETLLSKDTVKRRLDALQDIDLDMYSEYIHERSKRHAGRKPRHNK